MKYLAKVKPEDVIEYWICNHKGCDDYGTITVSHPNSNEKLTCETCDEKMDLDSVAVVMEK